MPRSLRAAPYDGSFSVTTAARLHQNVRDLTFTIYRAPQKDAFTVDRNEDFIEMPARIMFCANGAQFIWQTITGTSPAVRIQACLLTHLDALLDGKNIHQCAAFASQVRGIDDAWLGGKETLK